MARTKATVRRLRQPTFVPAPGQGIGNKNMNRRNSVFKIKILFPQTKQVEVEKWPSCKKNERKKNNRTFLRQQKVLALKQNFFFKKQTKFHDVID